MTKSSNRSPRSGVFTVPPDLEAHGTLTLHSRDPVLHIWSKVPLDLVSDSTINGELEDLTHVSLLRCTIRSESHTGRDQKALYRYDLSPQYVLVGRRHYSDRDTDIRQIRFSIAHAVELFDDPDAYGTIFNNPEAVRRAAKDDNESRPITVGEWNWLSYYTGKTTVFKSQTSIGEISANHSPTFSIGDATNLGLVKRVYITIKFDVPLSIMEAVFRMNRVLQFVDLVVGYSENVESICVYTGSENESQEAEVYSIHHSRRSPYSTQSRPSRFTVLIHPVDQAQEFSSVLSGWLERDVEWRTARMRLSRDWGTRTYNYNRILAAANVFDLLPSDVYGDRAALSQETYVAVEEANRIFRALPASEDRDDTLGHLGRVGDWRLKRKIRHRSKIISDTIGSVVPDLTAVVDQAVNLRNHYVHGAAFRLGNDGRLPFLRFLTDSLEFIFFASDLVEVGWDIVRWCSKAKPRGHPFHNYLVSYSEDLGRLKRVLE